MAFGYRILIAGDVKGDYAALRRRHLGVEPARLGPGLPSWLNPLGVGLGKITDPVELRSEEA
ncbi:hypothetical protein ACFWB2_40715 [Streptomyces virginiae]|uniref:hypothetical protein n=1 Tax=Streptomyces virginiae TaxID=1961 RepID=UPI0036A3B7D8